MLDRDIKIKGIKDMYLKTFVGKRNGATVQRGLLIGTAVGGDAVGFDIGDIRILGRLKDT